MDFAWDDEQAAFRATVRHFLADNLEADWETLAHGPASEAQTKFSKVFCAARAIAIPPTPSPASAAVGFTPK